MISGDYIRAGQKKIVFDTKIIANNGLVNENILNKNAVGNSKQAENIIQKQAHPPFNFQNTLVNKGVKDLTLLDRSPRTRISNNLYYKISENWRPICKNFKERIAVAKWSLADSSPIKKLLAHQYKQPEYLCKSGITMFFEHNKFQSGIKKLAKVLKVFI